jgi:hypothetical protein
LHFLSVFEIHFSKVKIIQVQLGFSYYYIFLKSPLNDDEIFRGIQNMKTS